MSVFLVHIYLIFWFAEKTDSKCENWVCKRRLYSNARSGMVGRIIWGPFQL